MQGRFWPMSFANRVTQLRDDRGGRCWLRQAQNAAVALKSSSAYLNRSRNIQADDHLTGIWLTCP